MWAACGLSLQDPCKITTTKTPLRILSPSTTDFLSFSLKSGDSEYTHALRKQRSAHLTIPGRLRSDGDHSQPRPRKLLLRSLASSFLGHLIAAWPASRRHAELGAFHHGSGSPFLARCVSSSNQTGSFQNADGVAERAQLEMKWLSYRNLLAKSLHHCRPGFFFFFF